MKNLLQKAHGIASQAVDKTPDLIENPLILSKEPSAEILELKDYLALKEQLRLALEKLAFYEEQFKLMRQRQFGRRTEQAHSLQYEFPLFDGVESCADSSAAPEKETITYTRHQPKKPGRRIDTSGLPRLQERHTLSDAQRTCECCNELMPEMGQNITETVELIPRQCFVRESIRLKYACQPCGTLKQAPAVAISPLPKSFAGCSLIAEVIVNKYQLHQPLYRQAQHFKSHGLDIPDNTLGNWVMGAAEQLRPLLKPFWSEALSSDYLQVDETPLKVLSENKKAYMWCYLSPLTEKQLVIYDYHPTRAKSAVEGRLKNYQGLLQSDGYAAYNGLRQSPQIEGFACMAHARRKFVEVIKIASGAQGIAATVVELIKALYKLEHQARENKMTPEERQAFRQEHAPPILDKLLATLQATQAPPKSGLGKAVRYTLNQWIYLIKYVNYGQVEIDNNWVENKIRPFALGRKNWLFLGHHESAKLGGLLYSLIESAKLNGLPPYQYIHYLLTQVHALRRKEIDPVSLLPHRIDRKLLEAFALAHQTQAQAAIKAFVADKPSPDQSDAAV